MFAIFVAAGLSVWLVLIYLLRSGLAWKLATDHPNARSLHTRPTPRVGGVALIPVCAVAMLIYTPGLSDLAAIALFLCALSVCDDRWELTPLLRLFAHFAAIAFLLALRLPAAAWVMGMALLLTGVWAINLYNFMDGSDGLAGGMAVIGFASYACAASLRGGAELALASTAICGAALGFLTLNWHPARVFLGDAGSVPLGFLAAAIGLAGWQQHLWPVWFPFVTFSLFVTDATVTLLHRTVRRQKIWKPHREHHYQRMVQMDAANGKNHRHTAVRWYVLMIFAGIFSNLLYYVALQYQIIAISLWMMILLFAGLWVNLRWRRFNKNTVATLSEQPHVAS